MSERLRRDREVIGLDSAWIGSWEFWTLMAVLFGLSLQLRLLTERVKDVEHKLGKK